MTYLRRASPLHAARAAVALALVRRAGARRAVLRAPARAAGAAGRDRRRGAAGRAGGPARADHARVALPFALVIALVNPLVVRDGLTVIARLGSVPAARPARHHRSRRLVYGGVLGLRALVVVGCFAAALGRRRPRRAPAAFRRISFRSALTAALATRLVPVLGRDARRLDDAQRCLAGDPAPRLAIVRAVAAGALDRAVDVAATLEVRGYGAAPQAAARRRTAVVAPRPRLRRERDRAGRRRAASRTSPASQRLRGLPVVRARRWAPAQLGLLRAARRLRAAAVRRPPGDRAVSALGSSASRTATRARPRPRCATSTLDVARRRVRRRWPARVGSGKSTLLRAACGLVPHFHGGEFAGRLEVGGLDTRDARPGGARRRGRDAVPGPRDAGRDGHGARRAGLPAREPRLAAGRGRARGGGGRAGARHRGPARPRDARAVGRRAAARRARGGARGPAAGRAARRADLAARPRRRRRAARACCAGSTRSGGPRWCSPSTGSSAASAPPTASSRCATGAIACDADAARVPRAGPASTRRSCRRPARGCSRSRAGTPPPVGREGRAPRRCRCAATSRRPPLADRGGAPRRAAPATPALGASSGVWLEHEGGATVLRGVDLDVAPGERVALMGRNGAGKSTLLRVAAGLLDADARARRAAAGSRCCCRTPATTSLHDRVGDELPADALAAAGLTRLADRHPRDLSGGERQRLALAIVLGTARGPPSSALDEPTRGMDRRAQGRARRAAARPRRRRAARSSSPPTTPSSSRRSRPATVLLGDGRPVADAPDRRRARGRLVLRDADRADPRRRRAPARGRRRAAARATEVPRVSWILASFLLLGCALAAGFAWYERSHPSARVLALVATLAALAALGRIAFAPIPNVKPTTDIVLLTGYVLGGAPGFMVGAVAALASNLFFGQGPWTPWQMAGWGDRGADRRRARAGLWPRTRPRVARDRLRGGEPRLRGSDERVDVDHLLGRPLARQALVLLRGLVPVRRRPRARQPAVLPRLRAGARPRVAALPHPLRGDLEAGAGGARGGAARAARRGAGGARGRRRPAGRDPLPGARAERRRRLRPRAARRLDADAHGLGGARACGSWQATRATSRAGPTARSTT